MIARTDDCDAIARTLLARRLPATEENIRAIAVELAVAPRTPCAFTRALVRGASEPLPEGWR